MSETIKVALKKADTISKIFVSFNPYSIEQQIDLDKEVSDDILEKFFNTQEISDIKENNIEVVFMSQQIHPDDSIDSIKKKLIKYLNVSFDEIYLFANYQEQITTKNIYQILTQGERLELTRDRLVQFLLNFQNIDIHAIEEKDVYIFDDLMQLNLDEQRLNVNRPLGVKVSGVETDYPFTVDPFSLLLIDPFLQQSSEDIVTTTNRNLLMINGELNNNYIYVCLAEDVLAYTATLNLSDITILEIYYPYLITADITNLRDLQEKQQKLLIDTQKSTNKHFEIHNEQVEIFYNINATMDNPQYTESGINSINIALYPDVVFNMPTDIVFKLIHATRNVPLIKYNPGKRQEKIYRLYTNKVSTNGRKIPYLKRGTIFRIMREIGNLKRVTLYIETNDNPIICEVDTTGAIFISTEFTSSKTEDEVDALFQDTINPHIKIVKDFLEQNGYYIQEYTTLRASYVEILNINYKFMIPIKKKLSLNPIINCVTSAFNVETTDDDITMRFKRVANYNEMDSQDALIIELLNQGYDQESVILALTTNFSISHQDAKERLISLVNSMDIMQGINKKLKIKNNPGFLTQIHLDKINNVLEITVSGINNLLYLTTIPVYVNGLLQLTQNKKNIPIKDFNKICKKKTKILNKCGSEVTTKKF